MKLLEVVTAQQARRFLMINVWLQQDLPGYVRPLDKDVEQVFDPKKNDSFNRGKLVRYILEDDQQNAIGRIAVFRHNRYKNKGDDFKVGCFGFFECINNQEAANMLLNAAVNWLKAEGAEAMDGPVNFGERDKWWGLLIEGFDPPLYGMTYNPPYYRQLIENFGGRVFYYQNCWRRSVEGKLEAKFYEAHERFVKRGRYTALRVRKNQLPIFARHFAEVYNAAWASHEGNKVMSEKTALRIFESMKPVMDEDIAWFAYYNGEPVAFYINLPDLNQAFKFLDGKFNLLAKLRFLFYRRFITRFTGIVFGIIPRHQGTGVDYYMIVEAANVIQNKGRYTETELQWQGDFNPKMNNISKNLGFTLSRRLAVFRFMINPDRAFQRHPLVN